MIKIVFKFLLFNAIFLALTGLSVFGMALIFDPNSESAIHEGIPVSTGLLSRLPFTSVIQGSVGRVLLIIFSLSAFATFNVWVNKAQWRWLCVSILLLESSVFLLVWRVLSSEEGVIYTY